MGKRGIILGLLVISILIIISVSFVSANWFDDFWGEITGKVTENDTEPDPEPPGPLPCPTVVRPFCPDEETPCPEEKDEYGCPTWDCDACEIEPPGPGEEVCCETWPVIADPNPPRSYAWTSEDGCPPLRNGVPPYGQSFNVVDNSFCEESPPEDNDECKEGEVNYYTCEDGTKIPECACENGGWACRLSVNHDCPDIVDDPTTCAAKIQITFNQNTYKIGDNLKVIIEIFDSQGNHLPNYAFYGQMYDDRWHTPDLQKTDNQGYLIHTGTAEKPSGGVTEIKFKVYTKETSSCGSVQDTEEVKFEIKECGFGECPSDPVCKDKVRMCGGDCTPCPEDDVDRDKIFYPCNGCEAEDKCYSYGYRKAGNYCSDENDTFVDQLGDEGTCENDFECKTNLCIDSSCVSSNVWNKFLEWFKKLFGGGGEEPGTKDCSKLLIEKDIGNYDYNQSLYDFKEGKVPLYSEDGKQIEIIECCAAQYISQEGKENMGLICPFDNRNDLENSLNWLLVKNSRLTLGEYKGEKVLNDQDKVVAWTSDTYIVATGGGGEGNMLIEEDIAGAYLKKYPNDLEEIDISYIPTDPKPFEFCTGEDEKAAEECHNRGGAWGSDPSALDGTEEGKKSCIESKGFGEGCCEVYSGCVMSGAPNSLERCGEIKDNMERAGCYIDVAVSKSDFELCENIEINDRKDKCYVNVAEHTGNTDICDKVSDSSLQEKCYFWVSGQGLD
ncbi:hypothetical protein ACFLZJ_01120 [Nanoarchaeota archaeon]